MENESQQHKHNHKHQQHEQQPEYVDPGKECNEIPNRIYVNKCIVDTNCYDNSDQTCEGQNPSERVFVTKSLVDNVCCEHNSEPKNENPALNKIYVNSSFFANLCGEEKQADKPDKVYYDKVYVNTSFFKNLCCSNHTPDNDGQPASDPSDNIMIICVPDKDQTEQNADPKKCEDKNPKKNDKFTLQQNIQIHLDKFLTKILENQQAKNDKCPDGAGSSTAPSVCKEKSKKKPFSCSKKDKTKGKSAPCPPQPSGVTETTIIIKPCDHAEKPPPCPSKVGATDGGGGPTCKHEQNQKSPENEGAETTIIIKPCDHAKKPPCPDAGGGPTCKHEQNPTTPANQGQTSGGDGCNHDKEQPGPSKQGQTSGGDGLITVEIQCPSQDETPAGDGSICNHKDPSGGVDKDKSLQSPSVTFKQEITTCVCHDIHNKGYQHSHHHLKHSDNTHQPQCEKTLSKHSAQDSQPREGKCQELAQCEQQVYTNPFKFPHSVESQMKFYYDLITDPRYQICTKKRKCDGGIESSPSICRCDAPPAPPISEPSCSCDEVAEYENSRKSRRCSTFKSVCNIV